MFAFAMSCPILDTDWTHGILFYSDERAVRRDGKMLLRYELRFVERSDSARYLIGMSNLIQRASAAKAKSRCKLVFISCAQIASNRYSSLQQASWSRLDEVSSQISLRGLLLK